MSDLESNSAAENNEPEKKSRKFWDSQHQSNMWQEFLRKEKFPKSFRTVTNKTYRLMRDAFREKMRLQAKQKTLDGIFREGLDIVVFDREKQTVKSPKQIDGVTHIVEHNAEDQANKEKVKKAFKTLEMLDVTQNPSKVKALDPKDQSEDSEEVKMEAVRKARLRMRVADLQELLPTGFISPLFTQGWRGWKNWIEYYIGVKLRPIQIVILIFLDKWGWAIIDIFRGAGKTMLVIWLLIMYLVNNPRLRLFYFSENMRKTIQRVRKVRRGIATNKRILADYGYLLDDKTSETSRAGRGKSTDAMFELRYHGKFDGQIDTIEPSLMAITWDNTDALGYHYDGGIFDDPWSLKLQQQEGSVEKFLEWFTEFDGCLEDCDFFYILETRKAVEDLYSELYKMNRWARLTKPLVLSYPSKIEFVKDPIMDVYTDVRVSDDGILEDDCNGKYKFTGSKSILIKRKNNPLGFEREYQCNPIMQEGRVFKWKKIHIFNRMTTHPIIKQMFDRPDTFQNNFMTWDLAFGESKFADYNVILVFRYYERRLILVDGRIGRWPTLSEKLLNLDVLQRRYPAYPVYIEEDVSQTATVKDVKHERPQYEIIGWESRGKGKQFQQFYEGDKRAAKKGRIHDSVEPFVNQGRFFMAEDLESELFEEIKKEMQEFPACTHFDGLDAIAIACMKSLETGFNVALPRTGVAGNNFTRANPRNLRYEL